MVSKSAYSPASHVAFMTWVVDSRLCESGSSEFNMFIGLIWILSGVARMCGCKVHDSLAAALRRENGEPEMVVLSAKHGTV